MTYGAMPQYSSGVLAALRSDMLIATEPEFLTAVQDFSSDNDMFMKEFAAAWTKVMNADRYDGPVGSLCEPYHMESMDAGCPMKASSQTMLSVVCALLAVAFGISVIFNIMTLCWRSKGGDKSIEMSKPSGDRTS